MMRKWLVAAAACVCTMTVAHGAVDINKADQAALDGIKGIGPKTSKAIVEARKAGGHFTDWEDFRRRVKGIGDKRAANLSQAGLTIGGVGNSAEVPAPVSETAAAETDCIDDSAAQNRIVRQKPARPPAPAFVDVPGRK